MNATLESAPQPEVTGRHAVAPRLNAGRPRALIIDLTGSPRRADRLRRAGLGRPDAEVRAGAGRDELTYLNDEDREWISVTLTALEAEGVDIRDADALAAFCDSTRHSWGEQKDSNLDCEGLISALAIGVGEHIAQATGLSWLIEDGYPVLYCEWSRLVIRPGQFVRRHWVTADYGRTREAIDSALETARALRASGLVPTDEQLQGLSLSVTY